MTHKLDYWQYFLSIEVDLVETFRYIEPAADNFGTYSIELAKILLISSSEVDVICKVICNEIIPESKSFSINDHRQTILNKYPLFHKMEITIPRYDISLTPWNAWEVNRNPDWWVSYNKVKHKRSEYYKEANLINTINSVAGLFSLLLYLYCEQHSSLEPWPKLLSVAPHPMKDFGKYKYMLPDFIHF